MNSKLIRQINTGRIFSAIRQRPGITQTEIREATKLDRSTISTIVAGLERGGLVSRVKTNKSGLMGRPEEALNIRPDAGTMMGLSISANLLRVTTAGLDGVPRTLMTANIDMDGKSILIAAKDLAHQAVSARGTDAPALVAVGVTLPGERDEAGGLSASAALWADKRFRDELAALFECRVNVDAEIRAAALAESDFGAARGSRNFILVHSDSQLSGALYLNNRVLRGTDGSAGSLAHVKVERDGRPCACGARGCLQAYVTEQALIDRLTDFGFAFRSTADIDAAARREDRLVRTVLSEAGTYLGLALANTVNLLNVGEVVLSGILSNLSSHLVPAISAIARTNVLGGHENTIRIRKSGLNENASQLAALSLAMDAFMPTRLEWASEEDN